MPSRQVFEQISHSFRLVATILLLLTTVAWTSASAQTPANSTLSTPLTPELVGKFVSAYPRVQEALDKFSEDNGAAENGSPAEAMGAYLAYQQASDELDDIVAGYGFNSFRDWVQTMSAIVTAYTFNREGSAMDARIDDAITQIEDNPGFSAEQKAAMIAQMHAAMHSVTALRPDQASLDAVAAHHVELEAMFD